MAALRKRRTRLYRRPEAVGIGDVMVGGQQEQDLVGIEVADDLGGHRGGGGIAADRLQHMGGRRDAELMQLGSDHEAVVGVGDHQRRCDAVRISKRDPRIYG